MKTKNMYLSRCVQLHKMVKETETGFSNAKFVLRKYDVGLRMGLHLFSSLDDSRREVSTGSLLGLEVDDSLHFTCIH